MADYPIGMELVVDPDNPMNVVVNGSVGIYAPEDTAGATLLPLKDANGFPLANPLTSNQYGFLPPFLAPLPQVRWISGEFTGFYNSFIGLRDEAVAAKNAAQDAQADAAAAVELAQAPTDAQVDAGIGRANIPGQVAAVVPGQVAAVVPPLVAQVIAEDPSVIAGAAAAAQNTVGIIPAWKANEAVTAGQRRIAPNGDVVTAKVNFTTGGTYSATNWVPSSAAWLQPTLTTSDVIETLPAGAYLCTSAGTASTLGLPGSNPGLLWVYVIGTSASVQTYFPTSSSVAGQMWTRYKTGGVWQSWRRRDAETPSADQWFLGASTLTTSSVLDTLPNGVHTVWSASTAATIGLPVAAMGAVETAQFGTSGMQRFTSTAGASARQVWIRTKEASVWAAWARIDNSTGTIVTTGAKPASGFKIVPLALTLGSSGTDAPLSGNRRFRLRFNAPVKRWRLCIRNINPRSGAVRTGAVSFNGLWFGSNAGSGAFADGFAQIHGAFTTPADGSRWASPYFTAPMGFDTDKVLSFGYTAPSAPWSIVGGCWSSANASDAGVQSPPLTLSTEAPFDIWIEAETYATTPVLASIQDSLGCGVGSTMPVFDSALSQYCRSFGALPMHFAASGDTLAGWADPTTYKWTKWSDLSRPDAVLIGQGSNDDFSGADLATMKSRLTTVAGNAAALLSPNIYAATIMPRTSVTGAMETVRRDYNLWLKTQPVGIRDVFDFAASISNDDETIVPEFDADGIHLTTAGYGQNAASITRPMTTPPVMYATA